MEREQDELVDDDELRALALEGDDVDDEDVLTWGDLLPPEAWR